MTPTTFAYDRENRLIVVREWANDPMTITYDGEGLRRSKLSGKKLTTFVWDGAEYLGETTIEVKYMVMTTTYTVIQGMLVHETREGVETFYVPDMQGSLMECRSASGVKTYEAEYWPYGEVRTSTCSNPSPWNFIGLLGYFRDRSKLLYVRARHYRPDLARWQTVDPLLPSERAYAYVNANPAGHTDSLGTGSLQAERAVMNAILDKATCMTSAWELRTKAVSEAERFCRANGIQGGAQNDGICNAMQHCMWACLIAASEGASCALWITTPNETDGPCPPYRTGPGKNPPKAKCMDLYNNRVGINCQNAATCYLCCSANLKGGNCQVVQGAPGYNPPWSPKWRKCKTDCAHSPGSVTLPPIR